MPAAPRCCVAFATLLAVLSPAQAGGACSASSGPGTATLVELFTSEGCSSCPPADRWLSGLKDVTGVVPLAFHVDYWDHLGWPDRFASPAYAARQREKSRAAGTSVVYTPQVRVDGRDFRSWGSTGAFQKAAQEAGARASGAEITISAQALAGGVLRVHLVSRLQDRAPGTPAAYLALYENGHSSEVRAGENRGARLAHDYVVRSWLGPFSFPADGRLELNQELRAGVDPSRAGIAAVVETPGAVLQALALPLGAPGCR
ncbi:MAG TPA: DUF1223 domain-containing protein [Burkholderiales bacterium]|nr:DUF1223 domain-containing protein [Burkholderiales bacterium]